MEEASARLTAAKIVWGPVQQAPDVAEDPLVAAAGCIIEVDDGKGGAFRAPGPPVRFSGWEDRGRPVPTVGQHTAEVLDWLGYAPGEVDRLRRAGVIG
jgi:crotonobetainyl-CoA:carnitine CoA-transferase CaiB-like acyl-CoA transferase